MPSMYREVKVAGRLEGVLIHALDVVQQVKEELIAWRVGQGGSGLVHRKSYKQLCDAIDILERIPKTINIPDALKDIDVEYIQKVSTDKRRKPSRVVRLENALQILNGIDEVLPYHARPLVMLRVLHDIAVATAALIIAPDLIPWRFEKKPKRRS